MLNHALAVGLATQALAEGAGKVVHYVRPDEVVEGPSLIPPGKVVAVTIELADAPEDATVETHVLEWLNGPGVSSTPFEGILNG